MNKMIAIVSNSKRAARRTEISTKSDHVTDKMIQNISGIRGIATKIRARAFSVPRVYKMVPTLRKATIAICQKIEDVSVTSGFTLSENISDTAVKLMTSQTKSVVSRIFKSP